MKVSGKAFYRYMEAGTGDREGELFTPWADPHAHEYPFDFLFETPEAAREHVQELVDDGDLEEAELAGWVLVREVAEVFAPGTEGIVFPDFDAE